MSQTQSALFTLCNRLLLALLGVLGFNLAGCETSVEYGTPYATYAFKGCVQDGAGRPIEGIQVECRPESEYAYADYPPTQTNARGKFEVECRDMPNDCWTVRFADIDGPLHGSFADDSVKVAFKKDDYKKGKGGWNEGSASKEIPTIVLKEKND